VHHLEDAVYVSSPKALLDIEVSFADGSRVVYCTACNSTAPWEVSDGEITRAWIGAENIDARLAGVRSWLPAAVVSGPNEQFSGSLLVAQVELPTRVQGTFAPQLHRMTQTGPEPYIGGGEFCKSATQEMVYWVPGAPTNATAKSPPPVTSRTWTPSASLRWPICAASKTWTCKLSRCALTTTTSSPACIRRAV
jgi:hypothetical protein